MKLHLNFRILVVNNRWHQAAGGKLHQLQCCLVSQRKSEYTLLKWFDSYLLTIQREPKLLLKKRTPLKKVKKLLIDDKCLFHSQLKNIITNKTQQK